MELTNLRRRGASCASRVLAQAEGVQNVRFLRVAQLTRAETKATFSLRACRFHP